jgi:alpha-mannosidase
MRATRVAACPEFFLAEKKIKGRQDMRKRVLGMVLGLALMCCFATPAAGDSRKDVTVHLVGNAHVDLAWQWLWEETVHEVYEHTFGPVLTKLNRFPGLTFAQSQAALYEAVERLRPQFINQVGRKVAEKRWFPVGGTWAESDLNMPCGESLVRQFLYGQAYFQQKLDADIRVGWNPDTFGQNWALPQIMTQAGLTYNVFLRCAPEGLSLFWWEGLDGSRILCYVPPVWYTSRIDVGFRDRVMAAAKKSGLQDLMVLHGAGDHGGGPRIEDLQAVERLRKDPMSPRFVFGSPQAFLEHTREKARDIPVYKGELNFIFSGCYTSQVEAKKNNRKGENLLLTAERFASIAYGERFRHYFPDRDLDEAWKIVLRNQFHDILPGSSIGPVYDEAERYYAEAFRRARRALDFSLETIINAADTSGEGTPVVVFNPLAWPRSGPAKINLSIPEKEGEFTVFDSSGESVPFQLMDAKSDGQRWNYTCLLLAGEIPSLGYEVFRAVKGRPAFPPGTLNIDENGLENDYLRIRLDRKTGWITSLYDKRQQREMLSGPGNVLWALTDKPEGMSAWTLGPEEEAWPIGEEGAEISVVETGPVRGLVRVKTRFRSSLFEQDLILGRDSRQLDVVVRMDWHERNLLVKAAFPLSLSEGKAFYEIPYGAIQRPADGREVPALKWIDLSSEGGMSLLNDSRYGFDVNGNRMRISLVRGPTYPDPNADEGRHETAYALYPHAGDWKEAGTVHRALEFNNPLFARQAMIHTGTLPAKHAFLSVGPENIVVSAVKKPKGIGTKGLSIRAYEAFGEEVEAEFIFPWPAIVRASDIREGFGRVIADKADRIKITFKPHEIVTIHVQKIDE